MKIRFSFQIIRIFSKGSRNNNHLLNLKQTFPMKIIIIFQKKQLIRHLIQFPLVRKALINIPLHMNLYLAGNNNKIFPHQHIKTNIQSQILSKLIRDHQLIIMLDKSIIHLKFINNNSHIIKKRIINSNIKESIEILIVVIIIIIIMLQVKIVITMLIINLYSHKTFHHNQWHHHQTMIQSLYL